MKRGTYVLVQRTGFVPYFLSAWHDEEDTWDHLRSRALVLDGDTARRIQRALHAKNPFAPLPVEIESAT